MLITQLMVEEESSIDPQAYWVSFRSAVIAGQALFHPRGAIAAVRSPISVEVDQQEIRDFQVLAADIIHDYRIEALPDRVIIKSLVGLQLKSKRMPPSRSESVRTNQRRQLAHGRFGCPTKRVILSQWQKMIGWHFG
jgi:hypothetical protein